MISHTLEAQLQKLRSRIRLSLFLGGFSRLLLLSILFCAVSFTLDWWFNFLPATRIFLLGIGLVVIFGTLYRQLLQPLSFPLDDETLALIVENHFPELKESFISAVQLGRDVDSPHPRPVISRELVEVLVTHAEKASRQVPLKRVVSFQKPAGFACAAAIVLSCAGLYAVLQPTLVQIWAKRLINPFSTERWPRKTRLEIVNLGQIGKIARGDDLEIEVAVTRGSADRVMVDFAFLTGGKGLRRMNRSPEGRFKALFPRVTEGLRFRIRGGDDESAWYPVEVVERPRVENVEVTLRYPDYTRKPAETLAEGQGDIHAVVGTAVSVKATTDLPLARAYLAIENGENMPMTITDLKKIHGDFGLRLGTTAYHIEVISKDEIDSLNPVSFKLRVTADQPPVIKLANFDAPSEYTAAAKIPLPISASDDYGIQSITLKWQNSRSAGTEGQSNATGDVPIPGIEEGAAKIESIYLWDLSSLKFSEGDTIKFVVEAKDADNLNGPNSGRTAEYTIRIASRAQVEAGLVQKERAALRELEQLVKQQELTHTRVENLREALRAGRDLSQAEQESHVKAELEQRQVARDAEKIRDRVDSMLRHLANNQIQDFERQGQMNEMKDTLHRLSQEKMPEAAQLLEQAREQSREMSPDAQKLAAAAERQQQALEELRDLLNKVGQPDELDQLIQQARSLTNRQQKLHEGSKKAAVSLLGKMGDSLSETEKGELRNLGREQAQAAELMKDLEEKIDQMADTMKKDSPDLAQHLQASLSQARKDQIRSEMGRVASEIEANNLLSALKPQQLIYDGLQRLLENLRRAKDIRSSGADQLKKDLRSALEALSKIFQGQQFLLQQSASVQAQSQALDKVKRDLDYLRKEQQALKNRLDESLRDSTAKEQGAMQSFSAQQEQLSKDASDLAENTQKLSQALADQAGLRSEKLRDAATAMAHAAQEMKKAHTSLSGSQPSEASKAQGEADQNLEEAERLTGEAQKNLEAEMEAQLPQVGESQKDLGQQAEQASNQLNKMGSSDNAKEKKVEDLVNQASKDMHHSSEQMEQAQQQLQEKKAGQAQPWQEKARAKTQEAMEKVAKALHQLTEDERSKKLAMLEVALENLIRRQTSVNEIITEVANGRQEQPDLDRKWLLQLASAAVREGEIAQEGGKLHVFLEKEKILVYSWSMRKTVQSMVDLKGNLERRDTSATIRERADRIVYDLKRLLQQILEQQRAAMAQKPSRGGEPKGPGPQPNQQPNPLIPPLAELKMLRDLEVEVYETTKAVEIERVLYPNQVIAPWKEEQLTRMADQQGELARMAELLGKSMNERRNSP